MKVNGVKQEFNVAQRRVKCLAFSPCSKYLASLGGASDNYQLVLWRLKDAKAMCGRNTFGATTLAFLNRESSNPSLVDGGGIRERRGGLDV